MSALPPEAPRLDPVPFIVADALLVGAAAFIGWQAEAPLGVAPLACISALVGLGAIAGLYPFVVNHARRQEEALQDRANQIEALARTVGASAEQISIAVSNLPAIAENSARQLKAAEQLPAALQHQIAGLQHQLSATASEENAALRHELDTLRGAETAKLAAALEGLSRATADFARLEALAAKHSSALDAAITHLPRLADSFVQQAGEALRRETAAAVAALQAAAAESGAGIAAATAEARAALDRDVREAASLLAAQAAAIPPAPAPVPHQVVAPAAAPATPPEQPEPVAAAPEAGVKSEPAPAEGFASSPAAALIDDADLDEPAASAPETESELEETEEETETPEAADAVSETDAETAPAPEEEAASEETEAGAPEAELEPELELEPEPGPEPEPASTSTAPEPGANPAAAVENEASPHENSKPALASAPRPEAVHAEPVSEPAPASAPPPASLAPEADPEPEPEPEAAPASSESALSHDGYTRLLATAYIGIGNRLFVRGDGPGLRRDKGVPLQFVSIGKWRWESAELLFPAKVRLYKNDQVECTALGEIVLEPGHHHEVNATF